MNDLFDAVEIEINSDCNLQCSYCPNSLGQRSVRGEMEVSLYKRIIDELDTMNFAGRISYSFYNEPLLCSQLLSHLSYTRMKLPSVKIVLYTNGTLLSLTKFYDLVAAGVTRFIVTKQENIIKIDLEDYFEKLPEHLKSIIFFRSYKEMPLTNRGGTLPHLGLQMLPKLLPCYVPSHVVTITMNGNVLPCFEDVYEKNMMGNLQEKSLFDIWNDQKYQNFRQKLRHCLRHQFDPCAICNRVNALPLNHDLL